MRQPSVPRLIGRPRHDPGPRQQLLVCAAGAAAAADQPAQPPVRNAALEIAFGAKVYAENCKRRHETP